MHGVWLGLRAWCLEFRTLSQPHDMFACAWSGREFRGEVVPKKAKAENSAAELFLADVAVQETAANMDPPNEKQLSQSQKRRLSPGRRFAPAGI